MLKSYSTLRLLVAVVGVLARLGVVIVLVMLAWLRCMKGRASFSLSSSMLVLERWNWER